MRAGRCRFRSPAELPLSVWSRPSAPPDRTQVGEGDQDNGYIAKLSSADGSVEWDLAWSGVDDIWGVAADDDGVYFAAELIGTDKMIGTLGPFNSSDAGASSSGIAVKLSSAGVPAWVTILGKGDTHMVKASPNTDHVFVSGDIEEAYTFASGASLTGAEEGFVAKLSTSDGSVVWAVDTPKISSSGAMSVSTAGDYLHIGTTFSRTLEIGTNFSLTSADGSTDIMIAKLSAADGTGRWAMRLGGSDRERMYGMGATADGGIAIMGYTESNEIDLGDSHLAVANNIEEGVSAGSTAMV